MQSGNAGAAAKALLFGMCFLGAQVCRADVSRPASLDTNVRTSDIDRALASLLPPSPETPALRCAALPVAAASVLHPLSVATFFSWGEARFSQACPRAPLRCSGESAPPAVTDALPTQADVLRAALSAVPSADTAQKTPAERDSIARQFVTRVDPLMARHDASGMRFGSLDWALARIGCALIGDEASDWAPNELAAVALAMLPAHGDTEASAIFLSRFMSVVTRMALAHDVIEPDEAKRLDTATRARAIAYFRWRVQDMLGQGERLAAAAGFLPTRRAIARERVASAGVSPDLTIQVNKHRVWIGLWTASAHPMVFPPCMHVEGMYTPVDLLMHDCLIDLKRDAPMVHTRLVEADVTHDSITESFEAHYATAIPALAHTFLMPVLQARIDAMSDTDRQFWRCGDWTLHRAAGTLAMQPLPDDAGGALGVVLPDEGAGRTDEIRHFTLLMSIRRTSASGVREVRHYLITPSTLQVIRLEADLAARLNAGQTPFVAVPRVAGQSADRSGRPMCTDTVKRVDCGATITATQGAAEILAAPFHALHDASFAMTATEAEHAARREALLGLLPFYRCVQDVRAAKAGTVFDCAIDLAGLIPLADAGLDAANTATHLLTALGPDEWLAWSEKPIAHGLPVLRESTPAQLAHWLDVGARDGMHLAEVSIRLFDPGFAAAWHLSHGVAGGAHALFERLSRMPVLRRHLPRFRARIETPTGAAHAAPSRAVQRPDGHEGGVQRGGSRLRVPEARLPVHASAPESPMLNQLCRTRRSPPEHDSACSQLAPVGGYVRPYPQGGGETRYQFDAGTQRFETFDSQDAAMRTVVVDDVTDAGQLVEREYLLIGGDVVWRHLDSARMLVTAINRVTQGVLHDLLSLKGALGKAPRYVVADVPVTTVGGDVRTVQIAARYATFADHHGHCTHVVRVQGTHYVFKIEHGWTAEPVAGHPVTLFRATDVDVANYLQFRALLHTPYAGDIVVYEGVSQFQRVASLSRTEQMRIKRIVLRVQKVQLDALLWLTDPMNRAETELLLQRFTSIGQVASLRVALMGALESMTRAAPKFVANYRTRVAVALMVDPAMPGTAAVGGLQSQVVSNRAKMPVVYLNEDGLSERTTESLAGVMLHQMTRAVLGAADRLSEASSLPAAIEDFGELVDLRPLVAVTQSVPPEVLVRHAPTLEHLIFMCAYLRDPARAEEVRRFTWRSTDSYWRMSPWSIDDTV
ncbi:hypothetical protein [Pandoraea norimbergensis]|uniref:Uncharacterized protein n=2 Tax=Pseudomonadota TaxID=1224 RepID=A0ABN4JID4_9BURK|nr:hypothetical protein [Pandoraea norimbergensis]ALS59800.1 hypothetical protein AT302_08575 [Pandoraea norimbergensis]